MTRDDIKSFWADMPHKQPECVGCGTHTNVWDGGEPMPLWRCFVCHAPVCHRCTKTIGNRGREYHDQTLCSTKCWETAGKPED